MINPSIDDEQKNPARPEKTFSGDLRHLYGNRSDGQW